MKKLNFVFFGTPDVASHTLDILFSNGYIPSIIITTPDKPAGRGLVLTPSPVSLWAEKHNVECLKPEKITPDFLDNLSGGLPRGSTPVDLYVVVAYGKILPEALIQTPKLGTINIHYSLLPKYRGASPLEACLLNGDEETGVSIQQMEYKLDSGPILASKEILIGIDKTKEELKNNLVKLGGDLLCEIIPQIIDKNIIPKIQDESKTIYCTKINKEDGEIDINGDPIINFNKYRAFYGWPGVYFFTNKHDKKIRCKITKAKLEDGQFIIEKIIPESKKEINYDDFLRQN
jgi:methionyl-tRNA formyltransferase